MNFNVVKRCLLESPDLAGLDEETAATLLLRAEAHSLNEGAILYEEGAKLDNTFGVLVAGDLVIEKSGEAVAGVFERQVFGEMAYFTKRKARTATVRVGSTEAVVMKVQLTPAELQSARFSRLGESLGRLTWQRFVNGSQTLRPDPQEIVG